MAAGGLLGNRQRLCGLNGRTAVGTGTLDGDVNTPFMADVEGKDAVLCIPFFRDDACCRLTVLLRIGRLCRDALDGDEVLDQGRRVRTEVIQIEVDMVVILTDETTRQLAVV